MADQTVSPQWSVNADQHFCVRRVLAERWRMAAAMKNRRLILLYGVSVAVLQSCRSLQKALYSASLALRPPRLLRLPQGVLAFFFAANTGCNLRSANRFSTSESTS